MAGEDRCCGIQISLLLGLCPFAQSIHIACIIFLTILWWPAARKSRVLTQQPVNILQHSFLSGTVHVQKQNSTKAEAECREAHQENTLRMGHFFVWHLLLGKFNFLKMVVQSILYSVVLLEITIIFGCGFVISLVKEAKYISQKVYCILVKMSAFF